MALNKLLTTMTDQELIAYSNANNSYLEYLSNNLASPRTYSTLSALQTAYPNGDSHIYVVTATGYWYYWSGTAWTYGGVYQSTGLADNSVTTAKILDSNVTTAKIADNAVTFAKLALNAIKRDNIDTAYSMTLGVTGTCGGTSSAVTVTVTGVFALNTMTPVTFIATNDISAGATLNVNSTGAMPLYTLDGVAVLSGAIKAGAVVMVKYNANLTRWYLQYVSITIDTTISAISNNPISNNAVYNGLQSLESRMTEKTSYGVVSGLVVSAQSTPNMTVQVSSGILYLPPIGGVSARYAPSAVSSLTVTTADATNPRKDIVYVNSSGVVSYLAGTAAASPVQPSTPSNGLLLAVITVTAGATSITNTMIEVAKKPLWAESWVIPTLVNSWTESVDYPVRIKKDITGRVAVRGRVETGAAGTYVFVLPAGYRPLETIQLICSQGAAGASVVVARIFPAGYVYVANSYTSFVDLSSISFNAE